MKHLVSPSFGQATLVAAALLLAPLAGQAQTAFSFGPRVGLNLSNAQIEGEEDFPATKNRAGLQIGLAAVVGTGHFTFQPAVLYSQRGFKIKESQRIEFNGEEFAIDVDMNTQFDYLEIPLQGAYSQNTDGTGVQILFGPYIGIGLNGKSRTKATVTAQGQTVTETENTTFKFDGDSDANDDDEHLNRFDAGLTAGLGYRHGSFLVQGGYSLGLANLLPESDDTDEDSAIKNRAIQISLTYFLKSK